MIRQEIRVPMYILTQGVLNAGESTMGPNSNVTTVYVVMQTSDAIFM